MPKSSKPSQYPYLEKHIMRHIFYIMLVLALITACQPAAPAPLQTSEVLETSEVLLTEMPATEATIVVPVIESTKTPIPTPEKVVVEGREAIKEGNDYYDTNPNNGRKTLVAKIVDGKIVKEEFLNHKLVSCTASKAEIRANVWDLNKADGKGERIGDANLWAMVNDKEAFSDEVLTGQEIKMREFFDPSDTSFKEFYMVWEKSVQEIFDANPKLVPAINMGCFSVQTNTDGVIETYIGLVNKWKTNGIERFVTLLYKDSVFFKYYPDNISALLFSFGANIESKNATYKFGARIGSDQDRLAVLRQWEEDNSVPDKAEKYAFIGIGNAIKDVK